MGKIADQGYLRAEQYHDASNLDARIGLHKHYSTNAYGWPRWGFEQLDLPADCAVLEVGCGPGYLWAENRERIPAGWQITLADFSPGMLDTARQTLADVAHPFHFEVADIQALPFDDATFDAVIANHMLYHVPDRERAFAEVRRVLRPGGRFFAATNGAAHMREIHDLAARFEAGSAWGGESVMRFTLENGGAELGRWFKDVELRRYEDGLVVPDAAPVTAFIVSLADTGTLDTAKQAALAAALRQEIAASGPLRITKDTGLFSARRPAD